MMMLCETANLPPPPPLPPPPARDDAEDADVQLVRDTCRIPGPSCQALRSALAALYRLDDFFLERLGSGFFSDVYKVRHKTTGQVMVLKMNVNLSNRPNVLREVQLMNQLKHPNILRFRGVCVHAGCLHALTEFINGGSLEEWIQDCKKLMPWELRIKLAHDMSKGLLYLHSKRVFHRDLTSKNILINVVNQDPTAIVGDFGLADKIPDPMKRDMVRLPTVGSPWYMAPETLTGKWYDERADVFSFGIVLCEMIARIASDPDVLPRTQNFGVDYVAFSEMSHDCPPDFLQITFKCCLVEPKSRPTFVELCKILEELSRKLRQADSEAMERKTPRFLDDERLNQGLGKASRKTSTVSSRPRHCRRSTSLAYVDRVDLTAAQNRCLGEHMSRADPHYTPRVNPFAQSEAYRDGNKKIVGYSSSLSPTVFDVPLMVRGAHDNLSVPIPPFKNSHSCPTSPRALRRSVPVEGPTTTSYESSSWHCYATSSAVDSEESSDEENVPVRKIGSDSRFDRRLLNETPPRKPLEAPNVVLSPPPRKAKKRPVLKQAIQVLICDDEKSFGIVTNRPVSPDAELAYYSLSDQSSCGSCTPKSSSRCSNESDGPDLSPEGLMGPPVIKVMGVMGDISVPVLK
ncbi:LOW QUALITY PROTEIN: dual specificity testis-specific protein kinase 2-like [Paramacrobiotus metropolitanus]|uniref:LOW QUALITY PROTEIN: dual specificity testis-specific protein kinase 2-like n=1 Tax=Paramacrobiotus metropolitanus TaxID=2943436 RepID=UPI002445C65E|nr:LOW QUALITY PROTEIN: dual specificity testis-specific protein kinase 2-like [Paramacrobiotus metropolitanus]